MCDQHPANSIQYHLRYHTSWEIEADVHAPLSNQDSLIIAMHDNILGQNSSFRFASKDYKDDCTVVPGLFTC